MFLTCLGVFLNAILLAGFAVASICGFLSILFPCQPGIISSVLCSTDTVLELYPFWKTGTHIILAVLDFVVYIQAGLGGAFYLYKISPFSVCLSDRNASLQCIRNDSIEG
ncbi:hypothetical protein Fcan01_25289 [Folsomia candida]|uniref:Uncharacterized protein n=1 Tax=Folsomia candida TaxID=158441 RepID=A0A226D582_FOLCA|nr:hypothetical protein Fcan01_25289 [Folsomia candida]